MPQSVQSALSALSRFPKRLYIGSSVAAAVIVGVVIFAFSGHSSVNDDSSLSPALSESQHQEHLAKVRQEIIDSNAPISRFDSLSGLYIKSSGLLVNEAIHALMDSTQAPEGIRMLQRVIDKKYVSSSDAACLLGRLYYTETDSYDSIRLMKKNLSNILEPDNAKAHQLIQLAVRLDSTSYKALYELGCDYYAGEARTQEPDSRNIEKALKYFQQGLDYARQSNDISFINKYSKRIQELTPLISRP